MELIQLSQLGKELGDVAAAVTNSLEDKKVSLSEGIDIAKEIGGLAFFAMKNREVLVTSFKDGLSEEESVALHDGFCEGFNIKCETTEASVELLFNATTMIAVGISMLFSSKEDAENIMKSNLLDPDEEQEEDPDKEEESDTASEEGGVIEEQEEEPVYEEDQPIKEEEPIPQQEDQPTPISDEDEPLKEAPFVQ